MKTKKQFILDTLLPYKENPSTCGYDSVLGHCKYLITNGSRKGNRCAVGKHLLDGDHLEYEGGVFDLDGDFNLYSILAKEALRQNLTLDEWHTMQLFHDNIADKKDNSTINDTIEKLEENTGIEFPELYF